MKFLRKVVRRGGYLASMVFVPRSKRRIRHLSGPGFDLLAFVNEDVGRSIWLTGQFEPWETAFFQREIRRGDMCLDVGGNVGYMAMLFASCAREGQVHVFEPIGQNAALVRANAELNRFDNVIVTTTAVGAEMGEVEFSVSEDSAYSSIHPTGRIAEARRMSVPMTTLDAYLAQESIDRVDILKVDVEGAEELVLEGASKLLGDAVRRPRIALLELFDKNLEPFDSSVTKCIARMEQFGYRPFVLEEGKGELVPFRPEMTNVIYNIFFQPN